MAVLAKLILLKVGDAVDCRSCGELIVKVLPAPDTVIPFVLVNVIPPPAGVAEPVVPENEFALVFADVNAPCANKLAEFALENAASAVTLAVLAKVNAD